MLVVLDGLLNWSSIVNIVVRWSDVMLNWCVGDLFDGIVNVVH